MNIYLAWDVINLAVVTTPLFFLFFQWQRSPDAGARLWLGCFLVLIINQMCRFSLVTGYLPLDIHFVLNDLVFLLISYCLTGEVLPDQRFRRIAFKVNLLVLVLVLISLPFLPEEVLAFLGTLLLAWLAATLIYHYSLMAVRPRREQRYSLYIALFLIFLAYLAYADILLTMVISRISTTIAFIMLAAFVGRKQRDLAGQLEKRRDNLVNERDIILSIMSSLGEVRSISEVDQTLEIILRRAMEVLRAQAGAIYLIDPESGKLSAVVVEGYFPPLFKVPDYATTRKEHIARLMKKHRIDIGEGLIGSVAQDRQSILVRDGSHDSRITQYGKDAASVHSLLASPLQITNDLLGVMAVVNKETGESFDTAEQDLFDSLATQTAITINNAKLYANLAEQERMRRELEFAKRIQQNMLPKAVPRVHGIQLSGDMIPALEVGGDYYDFIKRSDDRVNMVIGDVSGKGIPAGMIMLMIRTILHAVSGTFRTTKEVVCAASKLMLANLSPGEFMTLIYLDWDHNSKQIHYTSAGHEHIVIYRAVEGKCENIMSGGIAIGMHDEIDQFIEEKSLTMGPGDVLVLYTDGITEAFNTQGDMYGLERMMEVVEQNHQESAEAIKNNMIDDIKKFVGDTPQHDDITTIVAKIV